MSAFKDWLNGLTSKSTPVDADELYVRDSSGTPGSKKLTWANLKATLANTFLSLTGGTLAGGTRTTSGSTLTITETLNNAGVTFPGTLILDVTDTASNAASLIANFKVGGASRFSVSKSGSVTLTNPYSSLDVPSGGNLSDTGNPIVRWSTGVFRLAANVGLGWASVGSAADSASDTVLYRDAAGTLAQRNGTNAQTFRNYGTYTDASNYRRVALAMTTAGVATLTPEGAGTGASGNVLHISGLPTSNPGAGILWNDTGTVKVGT